MNEKITYNWRYISIAVFFTVFALAIITQMVRIQLVVNTTDLPVTGLLGQWEKAASRRGLILDRNGHILAGNQTVYVVDVNFEEFYQEAEIEEVKMLAETAIEVFGINNQYLLEFIQQEPRPLTKNITVERFATQEELLAYLALVENYYGISTPGQVDESSEEAVTLTLQQRIEVIDCTHLIRVSCSPHLIRSYPEHKLASNIIGFVMRDLKQGQLGIEEKYNSTLFGNDRTLWALWDPHKADQAPDPDHGANIILTIDSVLQADVEQILDKTIKKTGALAGTVIVMDPRSGELLALASSPRADINEYWSDDYIKIINNLDNVLITGLEPMSLDQSSRS